MVETLKIDKLGAAGEDGLEYAQDVYGILKEMQMKLEPLV